MTRWTRPLPAVGWTPRGDRVDFLVTKRDGAWWPVHSRTPMSRCDWAHLRDDPNVVLWDRRPPRIEGEGSEVAGARHGPSLGTGLRLPRRLTPALALMVALVALDSDHEAP